METWKSRLFGVDAPKECSIDSQNKFVYDVLHDSYLWKDEVPDVNVSQSYYASPESVLKELRSSHDPFSFMMSAKEEKSYFQEGKNDNFGFDFIIAPIDETRYPLLISYVYPNSPAKLKGINRGEFITKVDGIEITKTNYHDVLDVLEKQDSVTLTFLKQGAVTSQYIQKSTYNIEPILYHDVLRNGNHRVGYMVFQDFIDTAIPSVDSVFISFKQDHVNDLILDLRYNGGGSDKIAGHLASLIGGSNVANNIFHRVSFNQRYAHYNYEKHFEQQQANALNLNRVFVITTKATCSASELVINALRASANNIEVIQVGSATCGKPYGYAEAGIFCDKALFAIDMTTKNSDGEGDYIHGLIPTCSAEDGYLNDFGDPSESMLQEVLYYIDNGSCSSNKSARSATSFKPKVLKLPKAGFKRIMGAY